MTDTLTDIQKIDRLLERVSGINDERDSVPILLELRSLWPKVRPTLVPKAEWPSEEEIARAIKGNVRAVLTVMHYHGERDQIQGASVSDASIAEAARAVRSLRGEPSPADDGAGQ